MKIFDCFTFFNEKELLELRFMEYYDIVDYFVIVEATKTQTGLPHKPIFEELKPKFPKYLDKVIHVVVDDMPDFEENNIWTAENFQRNAIERGLNGIAEEGDAIFVSDVDEFWNKDKLKDCIEKQYPVVFAHKLFHFWLNAKRNYLLRGTCYAPYGFMSPQEMRNYARGDRSKIKYLITKNAGWHYSALGDAKNMQIRTNSLCEGNPKEKINIQKTQYLISHLKNLPGQIGYLTGSFKLDGPEHIHCLKEKYPHLYCNDKIVIFVSWINPIKDFLSIFLNFKLFLKHPRKYFKNLAKKIFSSFEKEIY